jgi:ribonuclease E
MIEEEAAKDNIGEIQMQLPLDLATFILNEKRDVLAEITNRQNTQIVVLPNQHLETPQYKIKCIQKSGEDKNSTLSYKLVETPDSKMPAKRSTPTRSTEKPAVGSTFKGKGIKFRIVNGLKNLLGKIFKKNKVSKKPVIKTSTVRSRNVASKRTQSKRRPASRVGSVAKKPRDYHTERTQPKRTPRRRDGRTRYNTAKSPVNDDKKQLAPPSINTYPEISGERMKTDNIPASPKQQEPTGSVATKQAIPDNTRPTENIGFAQPNPVIHETKIPEPMPAIGNEKLPTKSEE